MKHEDKTAPEPGNSILDSCVQFCNIIITGKETATGLKYDEENMFAPMVVFLERGSAAETLVQAAEKLNVPVVKNILLAKNLMSYGKIGESIPEASYRDVSLALSRLGTVRNPHRTRKSYAKCRQGVPLMINRPLSLELGESLFTLTGEEPGREQLLLNPLNEIRRKLIRLLGITIPAFRVSRNPSLNSDEYRFLFKGLEAGRGRLELGWYRGEAIPEMMIKPENIRAAVRAACMVLLRRANEIIQKRAPELLGRDEVEAILDAAEEKYPVVTGEVKSLLPLGIIREILMSLVSEQVSIRPITVILETLADWGSFGPAPSDMIIDQIRQSLKRQICLEYTDEKLSLRVLTLEANLEKSFTAEGINFRDYTFRDANDGDPGLTVGVDQICTAALKMKETGMPAVLLCSPKARAQVKEATRRRVPDLAVLSYLEIPADINIVPVGEVRLDVNEGYAAGAER
ncbi:MAG: FHIPEP family type III secretion protein [Treponema sp.]|nr:FHIPEP family type III secretion protein [Treponema sp.]